MNANKENNTMDRWAELLKAAVEQPGLVLAAYNNFHNYSLGNQIAAMFQCAARGIAPGPISTYANWIRLGRHVRKGEKAIELCQPLTCKRKSPKQDDEDDTFTLFSWKKSWFVLAQTEGEAIETVSIPEWNRAAALESLGISEVPFELTNGNVQGYARERQIAISPVAAMPHKTTFHELAHIVLGHTSEGEVSDSETTPRDLREVEAESVALLCCESLSLEGADHCRGYIQGWIKESEIPERSAQRIFKAADQILKAGQVDATPPPAAPVSARQTEAEAINELTEAIKQLAEANEATAANLATITEAAPLSLEEELVALDARQAELLEQEKTVGFSRRWSSLNAQSIRHKRARIQERQIEIREQIGRYETETAA